MTGIVRNPVAAPRIGARILFAGMKTCGYRVL
jgi:hypothetical protein